VRPDGHRRGEAEHTSTAGTVGHETGQMGKDTMRGAHLVELCFPDFMVSPNEGLPKLMVVSSVHQTNALQEEMPLVNRIQIKK
jgi:hypothetical protein